MSVLISVTPEGEGWSVRSDALEGDLAFAQGGRAETAARNLAARHAAEGRPAEVRIFLRDGALAGRYLHEPLQRKPMLVS